MRKSIIAGTLGIASAAGALAAGCGRGDASGSPSFDSNVAPPGAFAGASGPVPTLGPRPSFPATVTASSPPPPISGGTLLVTRDGTVAIVADPDRDAVYGVDLATRKVRFTTALHAGDEPGRLVEDGAGHVHVALRGGAALVTLEATQGTLIGRRPVCPAPRGVAWDATSDTVTVACATGELVTLPASGGAATRSIHVERDLRDVVMQGGGVSVSTFRLADVLRLDADGKVQRRDALPSPDAAFRPHVAWRTTAGASGTLVAVHQVESTQSLSTKVPGGYGGGGGIAPLATTDDDGGFLFTGDLSANSGGGDAGPFGNAAFTTFSLTPSAVMSVLTILAADGTVLVNRGIGGVLPVDVAVSADATRLAVATPGSAFTPTLSTLAVIDGSGRGTETDIVLGGQPQLTAVAFDGSGNILGQTREPAQLLVLSLASGLVTSSIDLSATTRADTGHDVFHTQAGALIACASCHPEGGDDGHTWVLDGNQRRTPSLRGTVAGTAPYHWPGDQPDLPALVHDVYTSRMSGAELAPDQMTALTGWVQSIPQPPAPSWVDPSAASKGRALFERSDTRCSTCHAGSKLTNNQTVDVGTGGAFQVPPLVGVGWRTPLLHNGCAATLADRFGSCATVPHGNIASLSSGDIANLIAYLETL